MKADRPEQLFLLEAIMSLVYLSLGVFWTMKMKLFSLRSSVMFICGMCCRRCSRSSSSMSTKRWKKRKRLSFQQQTQLLSGTKIETSFLNMLITFCKVSSSELW